MPKKQEAKEFFIKSSWLARKRCRGGVSMNVTRLSEEHFLSAVRLSEYAFQYKVAKEDLEQRFDNIRKNHLLFGVLENEELAAKLHLLPLASFFGETEYKMGGLAGVATYPEFRRKGYVRELIKFTLEYMNENGFSISMLHPFSVPFYRKYGWELFSNKLIVSLKKSDLIPFQSVPGYMKRYTKETHPDSLETVYNQYTKLFNGMLLRTREWWLKSVYGDLFSAVYYSETGIPRGYIIYQVKDHKLTVEEFVALDSEARTGLWNYICQHDSMADQVEMTVHEGEPLFFMLKEPRIKAEIKPYFMARIVNAEQFLNQYDFKKGKDSTEIILHISDTYAEWNNKSFQIRDGSIKAIEKSLGSNGIGIHLDINALTAVLFGYKHPSHLFATGMIKGTEQEIGNFDGIIPDRKPFMYDFF
jgi:predicted acetyltransferase